MPKVNHQELEGMIEKTDEEKESLIVRGDTGIGKSVVVKEKAKKMAENEGREFLEWNDLSVEKREEIVEGEVDYEEVFIFIDKRFAESDPSDTKGIPDLDGDYTKWKVPLWVMAITQENVRGYVFLDEFNQAPSIVQASFFSLILDREIVERKLSDGIHIVGAGNRVQDSSAVNQMPDPLKDRFVDVTLRPPKADIGEGDYNWADWAVENDIDSRVVSFLSSKVGEDQIHRQFQEGEDEDVFPTPRSWERVSDLIKDMNTNHEMMATFTSSCVGDTAANRFITYVQELENQNIEEYIHNPEKAEEVNEINSIDEKYKIITALGHTIVQVEEYEYDQEEICRRLMKIGFKLDVVELHTMLIRVAKLAFNGENEGEDEVSFSEFVVENYEEPQEIENRIGKYLT